MSIILKSNELNALIYKYLLEAGLNHTAYTLFNESALAQSLQQFKYDIKAGHLLALLQKGLVLTQIESHIHNSQYLECYEPFYLLKSHICKITEKIRQMKDETMKELVEKINDGIKRTNSIYHTEVANKELDEIVYEAKGNRYFDNFTKIKLPNIAEAGYPEDHEQINRFIIEGVNSESLAVYQYDENSVSLLKSNQNDDVNVERQIPCLSQGQFSKMVCFTLTPSHLIQVYPNNFITVLSTREDVIVPIELKSGLQRQIVSICWNKNLQNLICFCSEDGYEAINLQNMKVVKRGQGKFIWRYFDQCIILDQITSQLSLRNIFRIDEKILLFNTYEMEIDQIQVSQAQTYFSIVSFKSKIVYVYTFENSQPLYIFNFQEEKFIKQVLWTCCKEVEYLVFLTSKEIKIWEIDLNAYSRILQISEYDTGVRQIFAVGREDRVFILGLGNEHIIVYDISNGQVERMDLDGSVSQMKSIGNQKISLITQTYLYLINGNQLQPLFK